MSKSSRTHRVHVVPGVTHHVRHAIESHTTKTLALETEAHLVLHAVHHRVAARDIRIVIHLVIFVRGRIDSCRLHALCRSLRD